jgi:predicted Zn-dependent protease
MPGKVSEKTKVFLLAFAFAAAGCLASARQTLGQAGLEEAFLKHLNGGVELAGRGKTAEAIAELKKAAEIKPEDPLVLVNLGQAYQLTGKNTEALDLYKKYLSLYPTGSHVAQITTMFKTMQAQVLLSGGKTSKGLDNYLSEAMAASGGRWEQSRMPLRIYIDTPAGVAGYRSEFAGILKNAFADWCEASRGRLSVTYVAHPAQADIICKWTASVKDLANPSEGGQAFVQLNPLQRSILKADLLLLTSNSNVPPDLEPATYMRLICLHETGHALGLAGHSSQSGDVMYSVMNYGAGSRDLSDRDRKTIYELYAGQSVPENSGLRQAAPVILQMSPGAGGQGKR